MRKGILLLTFIFLFCSSLFAQVFRFGLPNLELYDRRFFHFGFSLGIDIVDVNLKTLQNYDHPESISKFTLLEIYSKATPAFNVGIVANMRLGKYFDLRFIPGFSIAHDIDLYYRFKDSVPNPNNKDVPTQLVLRKVECHYINFPLFIKFKSSRMHNVRLYVLAGGQFSVNMMSAKNNNISTNNEHESGVEMIPIIKPYDIQVKGGFGFDFYTTYFKFTTEFKVSFGVIDMRQNEKGIKDKDQIQKYLDSPIIRGIKSLKSKTFTISFIIE